MDDSRPRKFEVGIFNQQVADAMANGTRHRHLKDEWAEVHYVEVMARSQADAQRKLQIKYPAEQGYVITSVELAEER